MKIHFVGVAGSASEVSALRDEVFAVPFATGPPPQLDQLTALPDVVDVVRALTQE